MEALFERKIIKLLEKHEITVSNEEIISKQLAFYMYNMVFNICALIATNTLIHDKEDRKVTPEHIKTSLAYVITKCYNGKKKQKGGSTELYESMRNAEISDHMKRGGGISVFTIIFTKVVPDKELFPSRFIKEIFDDFKVTIGDSSLKEVKHVLKMHLSCLMSDLKKSGAVLSPEKVDKVIKMKRHSVFL